MTVIKIINNATAIVQARVTVTATGITLFWFTSGASNTDTSTTFAVYPTISQLVAHINGLGNGWSAQYVGDANNYGAWPAADVWVPNGDIYDLSGQGQGVSPLPVKTPRSNSTPTNWRVTNGTPPVVGCSGLFRTRTRSCCILKTSFGPSGLITSAFNTWPGSPRSPRTSKKLAPEWVNALYWQTQRDPGLKQETIPGSVTRTPFSTMPPGVQQILDGYKDHKILSLGG